MSKKKKKKIVADEKWFKENKLLLETIIGYEIGINNADKPCNSPPLTSELIT